MQHSFLFSGGDYQVDVDTSPLRCTLVSKKQEPGVCWRLERVGYLSDQGAWAYLDNGEIDSSSEHGCHVRLDRNDDSGALSLILREEGGVLSVELQTDTLQAKGQGVCWTGVELHAGTDEHYLGLGERFDSLDQRGKEVDLWVTNGATGGLTYKPVPFYLSSAGYGLHIDSERRCKVRLAIPDDPARVAIRNADASLRVRIIPGESPKAIISRYTDLCGRPKLPPKWVFGPWKSRDWKQENQDTVYEDADKQRALNLPATVKLIDALWEPASHTFTFDRGKYPKAQRMVDDLHTNGYRLVLWLSPWIVYDEDPEGVWQYCADQDFLIHTTEGEPYVHRLGNSPTFFGSCFDFTNPDARRWWQQRIRHLVAEYGVSGFKTDFGEQVPEDAVFYDERTGAAMHNIFPRIYNEATYEAMQQETDGVLLARSAWHGSQRLSAVWAGDQSADFGPASGLPSVIVAGQAAGISGFPYWASDVGGYFGVPTDEVFMRWSQFGCFSPIMQIHGAGRREPWTFSQQALDVYRVYAQLHIDLFPYIYTYARIASETGLPIMRALALEFPHDPGIWGDVGEHEYSFGSELLVAPVYFGFDYFRILYLPPGRWRDFWTGEMIEGGQTVKRPSPVERIPVFARGGAVIPLLDPSPDTLLPVQKEGLTAAGDNLRLDVYAGADGFFRLYDGTALQWRERERKLRIAESPVAREVSVRIVGEDWSLDQAAGEDGRALEVARESLGGDDAYRRISVVAEGSHELTWSGPHS